MKLFSHVIPSIILGFLYFNRNPPRNIVLGDNIVSHADGTIQSIQSNRIDIFINITDVHYQRAPQSGTITNIIFQSPMYNVIELETKLGHITIERWAGELARIVTTNVKVGQYINKGDIIGKILLGSHTSITIPPSMTIKVKPLQHILAGETVIAE